MLYIEIIKVMDLDVLPNAQCTQFHGKWAEKDRNFGVTLMIEPVFMRATREGVKIIQVLSGLVETALLRALEYQEAVKSRQYVAGTSTLKPEYFEERLYSFHAMREEQLASYTLLKLDYPQMSLAEADAVLQKSVRENDVWGISEKEELFLILSQTDRKVLPIILARLEKGGFICHEIDVIESAD